MKDEIKEIREYIACPQFGDDHYGKWGALRLEQRIKIKTLLDCITNLQEELKSANESITWWHNRFNALQKENKRLKELCDKYEEEHNTAFKLWTMKMEQMPDYEEKIEYKSRNEKAVEIYKNRNTCKYKKERFMKDKSTSDLMYEALTGGER